MLGKEAVLAMLDLLRRGYSWEYVATRYRISEAEARRLVREHCRRTGDSLWVRDGRAV